MSLDFRIDGPRIKKMSDQGRKWLTTLEGGCKLKAYRDSAGIPTIGVGQTYFITSGGRRRVEIGDIISTLAEGLAMFDRVLKDYEAGVDAATRDDITQSEFDAFSSFCYNVGIRGFTGSTAVRLFNERASILKVAESLKLWNRAAGSVIQGLVNRRSYEADLLTGGFYRTQART